MSTCSISGGLLYVSDYSGNLHCFDPDTGKRHWVHETKSPLWSSTFAVDGKVFLGTENSELWVLKAGKEKKVLNKIRLLEKMANTPTVANGVLYIATGRYLYAISSDAKK
jgi:outer membrane protein assembly factor BamB